MIGELRIGTLTIDHGLAAAVIALLTIGSIMVGSASISLADREVGEPLFFLLRHASALALGCVAGGIALATPMTVWFRLSPLLLLGAFALLVSVTIPGLGHTVNGSTRWIDLGALTVQPSEPARLALVLYIASYIVRRHTEMSASLFGFLKPMLIIAGACLLLLLEPDFGAAVVLTATVLGMLFVGGARVRDFLLVLIAASGALGWLAFASSYRLARLTGFMDPWADPYASGFQLTQSLIAIGRGEWLGVGLGDSVQKLFYLPEAHTDFVFAVLAEELGVVGSTFVIGLFSIIIYKACTVGPRAAQVGLPFQGLVATGIGLLIGLQAWINIGVNLGLLPTKGLTLPLISYGRTSVVVTLAGIGLLFRAYHEVHEAERRLPAAAREDRR
jgi:cell division protein FtsW